MQLEQRLRQAWSDTARSVAASRSYGLFRPGRTVDIPVFYGGSNGPDLDSLAQQLGMTPIELVELHSGAEYQVFFLGFQPGFPYLAGLPAQLAVPRRSEPRTLVPADSVGIGGSQTGIYPNASPGGWHLIGRTNTPLFDSTRAAPPLLKAGDRIRFVITEAT